MGKPDWRNGFKQPYQDFSKPKKGVKMDVLSIMFFVVVIVVFILIAPEVIESLGL